MQKSSTDSSKNVIDEEQDRPSTSTAKETAGDSTAVVIKHADVEADKLCVVCGDEGAKMHYGVLSCLGCKGFFRRALKKANQYECMKSNQCRIDKFERNSCRSCRLQKCLDSGMDPNFVRPDRDFTGKQHGIRLPSLHKLRPNRSLEKGQKRGTTPRSNENSPDTQEKSNEQGLSIANHKTLPLAAEDWNKKLPVEMRTMLMNLLNIEAKIVRGDTLKDACEIYPLHINSIKEMRYEPYRMARNEELSVIVYRRLIAAIDWVEYLSDMMVERMGEGLSTEDKICLVKSSFAPLLIFKASAKTAVVTDKQNLLCLCNFAFVPRDITKAYNDTYHLDNGLVDRLLTELVMPFRKIHLTNEEMVCLSAIIVLNPLAKDLSEEGAHKIYQLRDKIHDTLYQIVKESRPSCTPSFEFGNLLLYLPIVTGCANAMNENLRFAQTFSNHGIPLLTSLFGCFPVEPFLESEMEGLMMLEDAVACANGTPNEEHDRAQAHELAAADIGLEILLKNAQTQTYGNTAAAAARVGQKRRLPRDFTSPVENEAVQDFRLFRAPCSYMLEEMFDDLTEKHIDTPDPLITPTYELLSPFQPRSTNPASSNQSWGANAIRATLNTSWNGPSKATDMPNTGASCAHQPLRSVSSYPHERQTFNAGQQGQNPHSARAFYQDPGTNNCYSDYESLPASTYSAQYPSYYLPAATNPSNLHHQTHATEQQVKNLTFRHND